MFFFKKDLIPNRYNCLRVKELLKNIFEISLQSSSLKPTHSLKRSSRQRSSIRKRVLRKFAKLELKLQKLQ